MMKLLSAIFIALAFGAQAQTNVPVSFASRYITGDLQALGFTIQALNLLQTDGLHLITGPPLYLPGQTNDQATNLWTGTYKVTVDGISKPVYMSVTTNFGWCGQNIQPIPFTWFSTNLTNWVSAPPTSGVYTITAGTNITITGTAQNPVINAGSGFPSNGITNGQSGVRLTNALVSGLTNQAKTLLQGPAYATNLSNVLAGDGSRIIRIPWPVDPPDLSNGSIIGPIPQWFGGGPALDSIYSHGASVSGDECLAFGEAASASGDASIALGMGANAQGVNSVAIGGGANAVNEASIVLQANDVGNPPTDTAPGQIVLNTEAGVFINGGPLVANDYPIYGLSALTNASGFALAGLNDATNAAIRGARDATNGLGTAAFRSQGDFDPLGAGTTAAQQSTNGLNSVAFTGKATSAVNSTNFWGLLSPTNLPAGLSTSNYVGTQIGNGSGLTNLNGASVTNWATLDPSKTVTMIDGDSKALGLGQVLTNFPWWNATASNNLVAVGGLALHNITNNWGISNSLFSSRLTGGTNGVYLLWIGANDMPSTNGAFYPPLWEIGTLSNHLAQVVSSNWLPVVLTVTPRGDYGEDSQTNASWLAQVNNYLRTSPLVWRLIEAEQMFPNFYDTNFYAAGSMVHPNGQGYTNIANAVQRELFSPTKRQVEQRWSGLYGTNFYINVPGPTNNTSRTNVAIFGAGGSYVAGTLTSKFIGDGSLLTNLSAAVGVTPVTHYQYVIPQTVASIHMTYGAYGDSSAAFASVAQTVNHDMVLTNFWICNSAGIATSGEAKIYLCTNGVDALQVFDLLPGQPLQTNNLGVSLKVFQGSLISWHTTTNGGGVNWQLRAHLSWQEQ